MINVPSIVYVQIGGVSQELIIESALPPLENVTILFISRSDKLIIN